MATATGRLTDGERRALTLTPRTLGSPKPIACFEPLDVDEYVYPAFHNDKRHERPHRPSMISFPPFSGELRESQRSIVDDVCVALDHDGAAMCVLPTGSGKTVVALAVAARMAVRTLVVVHTTVLLRQWQTRAAEFLCTLERGTAEPIGIEMLQTLRARPKPAVTFGLVIYDEAHHVCARAFSRVMLKLQPHFALGLSATATRADGMHLMLPLFFGSSVTRAATAMSCAVQPLAVPCFGVVAHTTMNRSVGRACVNIARLVTDLSQCAARTAIVVRCAASLVSRGRRVLVVTQRRAHCTEIHAALLALGVDCAAMLGGSSAVPDACSAIVGTTGVVQEGFDVPWLDTLVFATPQVAVVQVVGRILRRANENSPLVVDLVDTSIVPLVCQYRKRRLQYISGGHTVLDMDAL